MPEEKINYDEIIERYPWVLERDHKCVISPDADGMLCGLFMSNYLNWQIVGYYDNGKNLILKEGIRAEECVFLDTEIYRPNIKSVGHHNTLNKIITKETNLVDLCKDYIDYVRKYVKGKKDKIPISEKGVIKGLSFNSNKTSFSDACVQSTVEYLGFLSESTGWVLDRSKWIFDGFRLCEFTKKTVKPGVRTFNTAVQENFLSLAITGVYSMEYTLERPDALP